MLQLFKECERIYSIRYLQDGDTMIATTTVLQKLQRGLEVAEVQDSRVDYKFVLNGQHGLFTRSVAYGTSGTKRDIFDKKKICTEIGNATRAIRKFFKQERFRYYVLGLNLGNASHDMAVFVRKNGETYDLLHFDPNERSSSKAMDHFQKSLAKRTTRRDYHPEQGNADGKSSYLAWIELLKFILLKKNPFGLENLLEYDFGNKTYYTREELDILRAERNEKRRGRYYRQRKKSTASNGILQRLEN